MTPTGQRAGICNGGAPSPTAGDLRLPRSFHWLNATQFLGALNDNLFKLLVTFAVIRLLGESASELAAGLGGLLFALPFLLFTPAAGVLADRISKRNILVGAKALEVAVMLAGAFALAQQSAPMLFGVLFLMSAQSALFGPAKYGIIPEIAGRERLSRANSQIVMATYLAIIIGTFVAPGSVRLLGNRVAPAGWICVAVAVAGLLTSFGIEPTPAAGVRRRPSWLFWSDVIRPLRSVREDRYLLLAIAGLAYFSMVGAYLQLNLIPYGIRHLGWSEVDSGFLFVGAAVGIGLGAGLAGWWSGRNVEFGVVPLGAALLAASAIAIGTTARPAVAAVSAVTAGIGAGLFVVPLEAFVQMRCPRDRLGGVLAANNFLSWIGVLAGSGLLLAMHRWAGLPVARGFQAVGALTLLLTAVTLAVLPDFLARFAAVVVTRTVYRVRALGLENLPIEGGALLVANHVSYLDALHMLACQQRRIRFLMHRPIYEQHPLRPIFRLMGCIPIAPDDPPRRLVAALREAREALDRGFLVCVFAEGALTRSGFMTAFRPGFERIVRGSQHPVIPVYLGGTWGSVFSRYRPRDHARVPVRFPRQVTVVFGRPMSPDSTAAEVRAAVQELSVVYFNDLKPRRRPLGHAWVRAARRNWRRIVMTDTLGRRLTGGRALIASIALARQLAPRVRGHPAVGVLLPPSVGGALANLALALLRVPSVNLNFTVSAEAFRSAIRQAGVRTVVTSRAFLEKIRLPAELPGPAYLEDLLAELTPLRRLAAAALALAAPAVWLGRARKFEADTPATIIFSSGTTGEPKGVVLSHHNLLSNVEGLMLAFRARRDEALAATLPLFHSFGYTCGVWFPLLAGITAHYHPNPLDSARIAQMIREERCTALFATPTFLLGYLRRAQPEDLRTLRWLITGAEKLRAHVADAFEQRFGIRPLEGYGTTELSPVVALSVPHVRDGDLVETGWKSGSVGRPIPGVALRIVDPTTGAPLPPGETGLLLVRGPNVMTGYLGRPDLTAEVLRDGWYVTGDIASLDEDGFLYIVDRLARFSKIGGEMVPHMVVEEALQRALGEPAEIAVAVTAVPDERRGERLVVLYTDAAGDPSRLHASLEAANLPNLWKPALTDYLRVERIPVTATGKLDVRQLRRLAEKLATSEASRPISGLGA
ncbi:MAG: acyl-[ACP]--phospholipid O-acyltransferase [Kiritimatiellae bacterium]|nr:acyl-[ACP]--phospholipid O-acyltransferase [Kiritimatiellia bacterium]